jgi:hypothetical protein
MFRPAARYTCGRHFDKVRARNGQGQFFRMALQPLIYFAAVAWAIFFVGFGLYLVFRRGPARLVERGVDMVVALLVAGVGAGIFVGSVYLIQELLKEIFG